MTNRDWLGVLAVVLMVIAFALPPLGLWLDKQAQLKGKDNPHA